MNKFKIGDMVAKKNGMHFSNVGETGKISEVIRFGRYRVEGDCGIYTDDYLELVTPKPTPHIHQKEIIAWANGSKIQEWSYRSTCWISLTSPSWSVDCKYRVEPEVVKEEVFDMWEEEVERRVQKRLAQIKFQEEVEKGIDMLMHND